MARAGAPSRGGRGGFASSRGRGRGRGRGGRGRGSGQRYQTQRVEELQDSENNSSAESGSAVSDGSDDDQVEEEYSSSDEDEVAASHAYSSLLQSLKSENGSQSRKRRKLGHDGEKPARPEPAPAIVPETNNDRPAGNDEPADEDYAGDDGSENAEALALGVDSDDDEHMTSTDPFTAHFAPAEQAGTPNLISSIEQGEWLSKKHNEGEFKIFASAPQGTAEESSLLSMPKSTQHALLEVKARLQAAYDRCRSSLEKLQPDLLQHVAQYRDVVYCARTVNRARALRQLYCLHALNHVFKTRDRVLKDNAKLAKEPDTDVEYRDQGFTRPKVLMILPTREACYRVMETIVNLCEPDSQEHRKRVDDSYHDTQNKTAADKPPDFVELFQGNDDDMFRIGIKFTRKTIKFFAGFYNSDIILASPLGLRQAIAGEDDKPADYDYLSSMELAIVDQADALLMQNWEHVEYIFEHINLSPKEDHDCDYGRVRQWYLEGQARYFRQTLVFSAFNTPEIAKLYRLSCLNYAGKLRIEPLAIEGVIQDIGVKARQTFSRFEAPTIEKDPDARFAYFINAIVPQLVKHRARDTSGTLIFIPSYLDFVRVRNYFVNNAAVQVLTFGNISEYATIPEASRARSHFWNGRHKVLLYTERAHHFRRYTLKGVEKVIMYGLPDNPTFYKEIVGGNLAKAEVDGRLGVGQGSVRAMFSKWDVMKLQRIVGASRVGRMIGDRGDTFDFV